MLLLLLPPLVFPSTPGRVKLMKVRIIKNSEGGIGGLKGPEDSS
jgi:hypothetical protein